MTLVSTQNSVLNTMLSVQQQQHHHHGLTSGQSHRGNVIVSTGNMQADLKMQVCKRSKIYGQSNGPYGTVPHQPASVARRNARERNRVKQVNNGFATLRQHIPQSVAQALGGNTVGTHGGARAGSKKLSKVETLRMAVEYIRSLQQMLEDHDGKCEPGGSPLSSVSSGSPVSSTSSTCSMENSVADAGHHTELRLHANISSDIRHQDYHRHPSPHDQDYHRHQHSRQNPSPSFVPTTCSEASSSPTPSYVSEASSGGSQGYGTSSSALYAPHADNYDNYEPMSPEDEELLDVISWWQQSQ